MRHYAGFWQIQSHISINLPSLRKVRNLTTSDVARLHKVAGHNLGLPIWLVSGRCLPQKQLHQWDTFTMHFVNITIIHIIHFSKQSAL